MKAYSVQVYNVYDNAGEFVAYTIEQEAAKRVADVFQGFVQDGETQERVYASNGRPQ